MKTFSALFLGATLLTLAGAHAAAPASEPDLIDFCKKDGGRELCLVGLTSLRCQQYAFPLLPVGIECMKQSGIFAAALELKAHPVDLEEPDGSYSRHDLTVIFSRRLVTLIRQPATREFIRTLMLDLRRAGRDAIPFNLWENAVRLSGGDEFVALERMGVLLQDTSRTRIQIFYLRHLQTQKLLRPEEVEAVGNLQVLQELIREERFRDSGMPEWLSLYPKVAGLNRTLNFSPYHFYTMAYAAARMKRAGVPDRWSYFLPFLFNAEYEFQELDPEVWPMENPRPFEITPWLRWKLQDIYAGYAGALFAIGRLDSAMPYEPFVRSLGENPGRTMKGQFFLFSSF